MVDTSGLFTPFTVRGVRLRNRFVVPSMQRFRSVDGVPSRELSAAYRRLITGGYAMVMAESSAIDHPTASHKGSVVRMIPSTAQAWRECAAGVRDEGGHLCVQLWHEGAQRKEGGTGPFGAEPILSPSGRLSGTIPRGRAITRDEMVAVKSAYARSAALAREAGASGVELHAAHGCLLDQFLWRETNDRADGYGGEDMADRVRYPAEVVGAVRAAVGDDFLISLRFSQWKEIDYLACSTRSPAELGIMLRALRAAGVDLFHASTRRFWRPEWPGSDLGLAGWARALTDAAVMTVGGIGTLGAEDIRNDLVEVASGEAGMALGNRLSELVRRFKQDEFDLVAVGRACIGDPDWVNKVATGAFTEIRPTRADDLAAIKAQIY